MTPVPLRSNLILEDEAFNTIYPEEIRKLSRKHWTPVAVAKMAAEFLVVRPGIKVLDIGSGAGSFAWSVQCIQKATLPEWSIVKLYHLSNQLARQNGISDIEFIH